MIKLYHLDSVEMIKNEASGTLRGDQKQTGTPTITKIELEGDVWYVEIAGEFDVISGPPLLRPSPPPARAPAPGMYYLFERETGWMKEPGTLPRSHDHVVEISPRR